MSRTTVTRAVASTIGLLLTASAAIGATTTTASAATAPVGASTAMASSEAIASHEQVHDTDHHLDLTAQQRSHRETAGSGDARAVQAESRSLRRNQQAQKNWFYCGPAAVSEALDLRGKGVINQDILANKLGTTMNGTNWQNPDGRYPVPDVLNQYTGEGWVPIPLQNYPTTAAQKGNFRTKLIANIDLGYPLIGNAHERHNGPHLVGHPNNVQPIGHWFTIIGYKQFGAMTEYEDSATSVWPTVPAYSTMNSDTITDIMAERGYVR